MMLKAAVIGVGSMGQHHARIYAELPGVELVGIADTDVAKCERLAHRYRLRSFADYHELLEETRPDAVSIAVPTSLHYKVALAAIERGVHVLIEKPIARTVDEAERLIIAAEQARVRLAVGHVERFNPVVIELKRRLAQGELGRILNFRAYRLGPLPMQIGDVGVVIDLATHDLDLMRYLTGSEITRLYAEVQHVLHLSLEDMLTGVLKFANGATGTLELSWLTPTKIRELYLTGERGMFLASLLSQDLFFFENGQFTDEGWPNLQILRGVGEGSMVRFRIQKQEPLRKELEDFVEAVRQTRSPTVKGEDGLIALKLAEDLIRSSREHRVLIYGEES